MSLHFLMCSERCGSNLITKIFNSHSNIAGPAPKHIFNPVSRNLFRYEPINKKDNWHELIKDVHTLLDINFSTWKRKFTLDDLKALAPIGDIKSLLRNIFYEEARMTNKQHVFIKENHVYEFLTFLLVNFPESKYVYQVRDPRDMALSWKNSSVHPGGIIKGAYQWQKDQQKTLKNFNELKKLNKGYLVTYEDLISSPGKTVKELVNFLGLEYESGMLNFYEDNMTKKNAKKQKAWENLSKGIISNNKNKYKNQLSEDEVQFIEKICYHEMKYLGYETEYEKKILEKISDEKIKEFNEKELSEIDLKRTEGVEENIAAKTTFYEKLI